MPRATLDTGDAGMSKHSPCSSGSYMPINTYIGTVSGAGNAERGKQSRLAGRTPAVPGPCVRPGCCFRDSQ